MEKTKKTFNALGGGLLLTLMVVSLILVLDSLTNRPMGTNTYSGPDKNTNSSMNSNPYPGPRQSGGQGDLDPALATEIAQKFQYTPSQAELSVWATDTYRKSQIKFITPPPTALPVRYLVRATEDIVNAIINDPFFGDLNQGDFGPCLKANTPGKAFFVKSLQAGWPDYYVVPFFQNGKVCGVYKVVVQDGMGTVSGWGSGYGRQFPPINADQARALVEEKTGQKVIDEPELVFRPLREPVDPLYPFWMATTVDGQSYFVIYGRGQGVDDIEADVYNSLEVHTVGP